jgi:ATP diphosphatase
MAEQQEQNAAGEVFTQAVASMARLRAPGGCPWDREQTLESIRQYTVEETYEVLDAIERRDWRDLREELGDLLLQVLFYAQIATENAHFNIADVVRGLNEKLIRRHPHVFGELAGKDISSEGVLVNWEEFKRQERAEKAAGGAGAREKSLLDAVPRNLPAAMEAQKIGEKAAKVKFDWPYLEDLFDKLEEELHELRTELEFPDVDRNQDRIAAEAGDLLFTAAQIARRAGANAEIALRDTNARFRRRFNAMEKVARQRGSSLDAMDAEQLENLWREAKALEEKL